MPRRGFFVAKLYPTIKEIIKMNKLSKILLVAAVLFYPLSIKADTLPVSSSSTASSTVSIAPMAPIAIPKPPKPAKPKVVILDGAPAASIAQTAPVAQATDINSKSIWLTAYASVPDETSNHPFITASGANVADGIVAANWLPFGTQVQIPALFGDKVFTVEDRMNAKFNDRLDIWMPSVSQALNFGLRQAQVVILDSSVALK
jgi:3D (Asp-Asp-Asp) domain-containing protein